MSGRLPSAAEIVVSRHGGQAERAGLPASSSIEKELGRSEWHLVTQSAVDHFADAVGDHDWRHQEGDQSLVTGGPVMHTYLALPLMLMYLREILGDVGADGSFNYGLERLRFPSLVHVGSRVRTSACLVSEDRIPGGSQFTLDVTLEIENGEKPGCAARVLHRTIDGPVA